jgi:predicted RNA-binding protein YlqC (UPF0109 family)
MTKGEQNLVDILTAIIRPALSYPESYDAKVAAQGNFYSATVSVHPADMPKVIGKAGNNVRAIKCILAHIGKHNRCFIRFYVVEPRDNIPTRDNRTPVFDAPQLMHAAKTALSMAGYDDRITGPVDMEGKLFLTTATALEPSFAESLARWIHAIGRNGNQNVVLIYDRATSL